MGKKLDLAFCYLDSHTGTQSNGVPSPIGYGISEEPRQAEIDQPCICSRQGYWQYGEDLYRAASEGQAGTERIG
jgi:hypothetical protein